MLKAPAPYYINTLEPDQPFSVEIYVNTYTSSEFFGPSLQELRRSQRRKYRPPKILEAKPDWELKDLTYTLDDPARNKNEFNYTVDLSSRMIKQAID